MARECPTFAGRPWVASELGTIAHLMGKDALLAAPQLKVAPARPLPASPECRLPPNCNAAIYLLEKDELPLIVEELPLLDLEKEEELPALTLEEELPALTLEEKLPAI